MIHTNRRTQYAVFSSQNFKITQVSAAIAFLVLNFFAINRVSAQDCSSDSSVSNVAVPLTSTVDSKEGASNDAPPGTNTVPDSETPPAKTKPDPSGSAKGGDKDDGGGTQGAPSGIDFGTGDGWDDDPIASDWQTYTGNYANLAWGGGSEQLWHRMEDPVDVATADKVHVQVDYVSLGLDPIRMARTYHSNAAQNQASVTVPMGTGWHMFYDRTLQQISASQIRLHRANGVTVDFTYNGSAWVSASSAGVLAQVSGGWSYYNLRNTIETYNSAGRLIGMSDEAMVTTLQYDANGRLSAVKNAFGRTLTFAYDASGRVSSVGMPDGTHLAYAYDGFNNLVSITFNDNSIRQYVYENSSYRNALTGVIDESGRRSLTWSYDSAGRPSGQVYGSNENPSTISYSGTQVITTDARGTQRTRNLSSVNGRNVVANFQTAATSNSTATAWNFGFDASGNIQSMVTRTGETRQFGRDARGRVASVTLGAGTTLATTASTTWHPIFNMPTQTVANGVTTSYAIDSAGRLTGITKTSGSSSSTIYSAIYNAQNLLQSETNARGTTLTYSYDGAGNTTSIYNQNLNQTTNYSNYNANGQPQTIQRPDGVTITRAFDSRGRMTSRSTPDGTTSFTYDGSGRVTHISMPDGSYVNRTYDSAGLLSSYTNNRGETTNIIRDVGAAVTGTNTYSSAGVLSTQTKRTIDPVGRTTAIVDSRGYSTKTLYGADGRPNGSISPLGYTTGINLDILNRPSTVTNPNTTAMRQGGGAATVTTSFNYSSANNLSSVVDPSIVATGYSYDALNRRVGEGGNDAGASGVTLNSAGDVASHTDPLNATIGISRDSVGRITATNYAGSADRTYTYVAGHTDALLAGATDSNGGSMTWGYDVAGRMLTQQQTIYGLQQTLKVTRDTLGRASTITYPSGAVLGINYSADVVSSLTLNGATLLSSVAYLPQTSVATGWRWGNGTSYTRNFDADGRVSNVTLGSVQRAYAYDAAGHLTSQTDTAASGTKQYTYAYDELGHVISYSGPTAGETYTYDANGNRRSQSGSLDNSSFSYSANTNRVSAAAEDTYQYNADGTPTTAQTAVQYDIYRRVTQFATAATKWATGYNALGQRDLMLVYHYVNCSPGGGTPMVSNVASDRSASPATCTNWQLVSVRRYMYDDQGRLLGEYDSSLGTSQETIWFNNQPVATIINGVIYYVNADNIGAPRSVVRASDNVEMWRWDSDPFGVTSPTAPNPTAGTIIYNLRFPGQVAGSAYYYNGARDYNPATGRYLQPDPSSLHGGLNRYGYSLGNPLTLSDPSGLQTVSIGWSSTGTIGAVGYMTGAGVAFGRDGISLYGYYGGGAAFGVNEGGGLSLQISNAHGVSDLAGPFNNGSASGGLLIGGTVDYFTGKNSDGTSIVGGGFTVGEDVGASLLGGKTNTLVTKPITFSDLVKNLFCHG